jgi:hypothetical protein
MGIELTEMTIAARLFTDHRSVLLPSIATDIDGNHDEDRFIVDVNFYSGAGYSHR